MSYNEKYCAIYLNTTTVVKLLIFSSAIVRCGAFLFLYVNFFRFETFFFKPWKEKGWGGYK